MQIPSLSDILAKTNKTRSELDAAELVRTRLSEAAKARLPVEKDWVLSIAFAEGRQWLAWDDAANRAISLIADDAKDKYITANLIEPLQEKWVALTTMTRPDHGLVPDTDSPLDQAAALEGEAIISHEDQQSAAQVSNIDRANWLFQCGVAFTKQYWDPGKMAEIPKYGPDGQMAGKAAAPVGAMCEEVIPPWEVFYDPWAKRPSQARYVLHATLRHKDYFIQRFGDKGRQVEPDTAMMAESYVDGWLSPSARSLSLGGIWSGGENGAWADSKEKKEYAVCIEMWEIPGPEVGPRGRLTIVGGKTLLYDGPRPDIPEGGRVFKPGNPFPIVRVVRKEAASHPYGIGLIPGLSQLQIALNRMLTRIWGRIEEDKLTVLITKLTGLGADSFEEDDEGPVRKLFVNPGVNDPRYLSTPGVMPDVWRLIDTVWDYMQHKAGIHDVQMGNTPPGAGSGIAIDLLQQGDKTQMGLTLQNTGQDEVYRGDNRLLLYSINASGDLPRLMGADQSGNAKTAAFRAMAFVALTAGGSCSMHVTHGSNIPKSPEGINAELMGYYQAGVFGPPGTPQASIILVENMVLAKSSQILSRLNEQLQGQQQQVAQMQQMEADTARAAEEAKAAGAAQVEQQRIQGQVMLQQAKTEGQLVIDQAKHRQETERLLIEQAVKPPPAPTFNKPGAPPSRAASYAGAN
jgi:hypothetical protein